MKYIYFKVSHLLYQVKTLLPHICLLITHPYSAVRHLASRCLAALSKIDSSLVMKDVINKVLLYLGASDCDSKREGAIEAIACILEKMQFEIIPYIVFLIVPLLGKFSFFSWLSSSTPLLILSPIINLFIAVMAATSCRKLFSTEMSDEERYSLLVQSIHQPHWFTVIKLERKIILWLSNK